MSTYDDEPDDDFPVLEPVPESEKESWRARIDAEVVAEAQAGIVELEAWLRDQ